jgi:hypothetical protein
VIALSAINTASNTLLRRGFVIRRKKQAMEYLYLGVTGSNLDRNNSSFQAPIYQHLQFIFRRVRLLAKASTSLAMFVRPSVCMQASARFSLDGFP